MTEATSSMLGGVDNGEQKPGSSSLYYSGDFVSAASQRGRVVLEAQNVSKVFKLGLGSKDYISAVRNANFSLYEKAVVALVGESGSGKSTIARLLAGQIPKSGGEILLNGMPVNIKTNRAFRRYKREVQMVFQDPFSSLNSVHKIHYHLKRPIAIHQRQLKRDAVEKEINSLLNQVRLLPADQFIDKYPYELSGGQRQRVAIARALAAKPKVLLADEPVSMLDVSIRLEVLSLLDDLRDRFSLAILYVTHDIASARYFADETIVIYGGDIVERGTSEDVTQMPVHPYTQLLVSAAPNPDALDSSIRDAKVSGALSKPRQTISALTTIKGCRFAPRCQFATDKCIAELPPLLPISQDRMVACWHVDKAIAHLSSRQIPVKTSTVVSPGESLTLQGAHTASKPDASKNTGLDNYISPGMSNLTNIRQHGTISQTVLPERDTEDGSTN